MGERMLTGMLRRFARNEDGATVIEYTMVASLMAMAVVAASSDIGAWVARGMASVAAALL
jgi:Flp pilus assembly pilin Flp